MNQTVIFLDRFADLAEAFEGILKKYSYKFIYTEKIENLIELTKQNQPGFIIMDDSYNYQNQLGKEFFKELRQASPGVKLIGHSAYDNIKEKLDVYDDYLKKPSLSEEILEVLQIK